MTKNDSTQKLTHKKVYPYSRLTECAWEPAEASAALSSLIHPPCSSNGVAPLPNLLTCGWPSHAIARLRQLYGENHLSDESNGPTSPLITILESFISQLKEPLILMLLASAGLSLLLGNAADAISIGIALSIVSLVAAIQEYRSEKALEKLTDLVPHTCTVVRDGMVQDHFPARELVNGDLVLLSTGDRIPADCRIVDSVALKVDESSLTGENHPVTKCHSGWRAPTVTDGVAARAPPLTEQKNVVFMGTLVSSGRGRALVIAVGSQTEFGKIHSSLSTVEQKKSPLQVKIDELGRWLAGLSSAAIVGVALVGWALGRGLLETVTIAVSLAVAAIPEGLPICVTVTLALGVLKMARDQAIVKKLTVVEALGCVTVVCSDKTGTLTQNEMTARSVYIPSYPHTSFSLSGVGYTPQGEITNECSAAKVYPSSPESTPLGALFGVASLCNNATLLPSNTAAVEGRSGAAVSGQPTELALLVAALKSPGGDLRPAYHRVQEIPFTSERKRMEVKARPVSSTHPVKAFEVASENVVGANESLYFVKGMPEAVISECVYFTAKDGTGHALSDEAKVKSLETSRKMAVKGLRVLALAYGPSLNELTFCGLVGMEDPPRVGVSQNVRSLRRSGVKVLMVTGDSRETAMTIAHRCGILDDVVDEERGASAVLSGDDLDAIPQKNMSQSIAGIKVFYRVAPRHKLALVRALQSRKEIVAMTGDGVNDATALKASDIGIAMGKGGTDVAKEAADIILADDDFSTITKAVAEGKGIFFNIRHFLAFQLSTSFAALSMQCIATLLGLPSPLNAMQILWINIIMDGPPAQSLGVEPVDKAVMRAKPRNADDPIVTRPMLLRAVTSAGLIVFLTLKVFCNELDDGHVTRRDTTMTFMTFVNCDLFNAYACRSSRRAFYELDFFSNRTFLYAIAGSVAGQLTVVYFPPLQEVFQTTALSISDMMYIVALSSSVLMLDTLRKKFFPSCCSDEAEAKFVDKKEEDLYQPTNGTIGSRAITKRGKKMTMRRQIAVLPI